MKKGLLIIAAFLTLNFLSSCSDSEESGLCSNGKLDDNESEVDCGGDCAGCPPAGSMSCTLGETGYVATEPAGQKLGVSIRVYGNDAAGRPLNFMFLPLGLSQPLNVSDAKLSYRGEPYTFGIGDSGVVVLTQYDTIRKIVSGTFKFSANRVTNGQGVNVTAGEFANIRYREL